MTAAALGLTAQDVADVIAYLKKMKPASPHWEWRAAAAMEPEA